MNLAIQFTFVGILVTIADIPFAYLEILFSVNTFQLPI